jgi:hypothetical protein
LPASPTSSLSLADEEMADTIKTLQRALDLLENSQKDDQAHLHRSFIECGLEMLIRMGNDPAGDQEEVPDWTITALEVEHLEIVETSVYAVVWKGSWREQVVAIKEMGVRTKSEVSRVILHSFHSLLSRSSLLIRTSPPS